MRDYTLDTSVLVTHDLFGEQILRNTLMSEGLLYDTLASTCVKLVVLSLELESLY